MVVATTYNYCWSCTSGSFKLNARACDWPTDQTYISTGFVCPIHFKRVGRCCVPRAATKIILLGMLYLFFQQKRGNIPGLSTRANEFWLSWYLEMCGLHTSIFFTSEGSYVSVASQEKNWNTITKVVWCAFLFGKAPHGPAYMKTVNHR